MTEIILQWGSLAGAVTALIALIGLIFAKLRKIGKMFGDIKEHTEENYLNNLRLVIMSAEMPIEERLKAGDKYTYSYGNTNEMEQCNKIAVAAENALKRCGFEVKRAPKGQNMYTSINESNAFKADVHICIHTNAGGGKGTDVFVYSNAEENLKYAKPVYNELVKLTGVGRGIKTYPALAEINQTNAKCVYCECEFHDNSERAKWIINNTTKLGEAIAKGICSAFGVTYKSAATTTSTASKKILESKGYKKGQASDGVLAFKELLLLAKTLKIHSQSVDENGTFGDGTEKAVNGLLKRWGYKPNGIAGDNFIKKLTAEIRKKI